MRPNLPNGREIGDDDPIMLRDAAVLAFPDGSVGERALRRMRDKGHLDCFRIAGKDYTTLSAVRLMLERSRVVPKKAALERVTKTEADRKAGPVTIERGRAAVVASREKSHALQVTTERRGKQASKPPPEPPQKRGPRKRVLTPRMPA